MKCFHKKIVVEVFVSCKSKPVLSKGLENSNFSLAILHFEVGICLIEVAAKTISFRNEVARTKVFAFLFLWFLSAYAA